MALPQSIALCPTMSILSQITTNTALFRFWIRPHQRSGSSAHLGCLLADPGVLSRLPPPQRLGILLVTRYSGRCRTSRAAQQPPHGAEQLGRTPGDRAALSAPSPPSGIDPHGPSGALAEQHPSGSTVERLPITLGASRVRPCGRATRMPHQTVKPGVQRTTTVTPTPPMTWLP